jgi:hypothetical protein
MGHPNSICYPKFSSFLFLYVAGMTFFLNVTKMLFGVECYYCSRRRRVTDICRVADIRRVRVQIHTHKTIYVSIWIEFYLTGMDSRTMYMYSSVVGSSPSLPAVGSSPFSFPFPYRFIPIPPP